MQETTQPLESVNKSIDKTGLYYWTLALHSTSEIHCTVAVHSTTALAGALLHNTKYINLSVQKCGDYLFLWLLKWVGY